ncbi:beta-lactamase enzyme family protein [Lyngbya aestuarii BL J]|uniref:Beta-lactamase enzyme family protein n=1 Tax=Lyngbya aestuarii BL J TaxID=1348334 RepID=U7Q978_9CYAN|nr:serine hydrolase [Lyngbya aestuarii]ERT04343.1 beta-lactamase enzyme family protein [Lyngbya aestuarii BL J]
MKRRTEPVSPQKPLSSDHNPKIVELEAKLNRAYKTIKKLRTRLAKLESEQQLKSSSTVRPTITPPQRSSQRRTRSRTHPSVSALGYISLLALALGGLGAIAKFFFSDLFPQWIELTPFHTTSVTSSASLTSPQAVSLPEPQPEIPSISEPVYNIESEPNLNYSLPLQAIIDQVINQVSQQKLSTSSLSIHLIDVQNKTFAEYRSQTPRFPASITKLFWMVALFAQVEAGIQPNEMISYTDECQSDICKLIKKSDNEAASHILDELTQTSSQNNPATETYENWLKKRHYINQFFQKADYKNIDISQKNYPIPELKMEEPQAWELKMRGNPKQPIRNKITAEQTSRLMYEIVTQKAVSPEASSQMMNLLEQDLDPKVWKQQESNPIQGFLGESLAGLDIRFLSKVGWTSETRFEVAFIQSKSSQVAYILTVFGEGKEYGENWEIFPTISRLVYDKMTELNSQS